MAKGGFPRGAMGGGNAMKQQMAMQAKIKKMQQDIEKAQAEVEASLFTATVGGGAVKAVCNGKKELTELVLNPEMLNADDAEMLQDMIIAAVNEAMRAADAEAANNMSRLTGGLNLGGLF